MCVCMYNKDYNLNSFKKVYYNRYLTKKLPICNNGQFIRNLYMTINSKYKQYEKNIFLIHHFSID